MLNSKFDLYDAEWIDLVFKNRNKSYGAYDLRKHYAGNMLRAIGITILSLAVVFITATFFNHKATAVILHKKIDVQQKAFNVIPDSKPEKVKSNGNQAKHVNNQSAKHAMASAQPVQNKLPTTALNNAQSLAPNNGPQPSVNSNDAVESNDLDIKPLPVGGAQEWSKFLEANLRYPAQAKQLKASGKVWMSFIVERDGHISNITVEHPAGYGFDEEAERVLKLSPVWQPGLQNGRAVRVKYTLPIDFHMANQ